MWRPHDEHDHRDDQDDHTAASWNRLHGKGNLASFFTPLIGLFLGEQTPAS